jgi:hypothetical protein
MIKDNDEENKNIQIKLFIMGNGLMIKEMDKPNFVFVMEIIT